MWHPCSQAVAERIRATQEAERAAEAKRAQQQQQQQQQQPPTKPLYELPIDVDGKVFPLRLYEGDVLKSAVEAFVAQHGFDASTVPILIDKVAAHISQDAAPQQQPQGQQQREPLVSLAVSLENPNPEAPPLPPIALYDGESPQAVAVAYCEAHGLDAATIAPQLAQVLTQRAEQKIKEMQEAAAAAAAGTASQ